MMKKEDRLHNTIGNIVLILMLFTAATASILIFLTSRYERELKSNPEQSAQVQVLEKRIFRHFSSGHRSTRTSYTYIVAFKFSDDSIKEFEVDFKSVSGISKTELYSFRYNSFYEGDTGMLTYKEIENIEENFKNPEMEYRGRHFISFEKDSD